MSMKRELALPTAALVPTAQPTTTDPAEYLTALDRELRDITRIRNPLYADFFNMLHYHLGWTDAHGNPTPADGGRLPAQIGAMHCPLRQRLN